MYNQVVRVFKSYITYKMNYNYIKIVIEKNTHLNNNDVKELYENKINKNVVCMY